MGDWITCPRCAQLIPFNSHVCESCGINLTLAAIEYERMLITGDQIENNITITPEILVPKLGEYLISKGMISPEKIDQALEYQRELQSQGKSILIGEALLKLGFINQSALNEAITRQILELQSTIQNINFQLENRVQERTEQLHYALDRLTELDQLKSDFISNISHELRTPLTHIKSYIDLFSHGLLGSLSEDQRNAIATMDKSEKRLEKLIDDLIEFALAWRGKVELVLKQIQLTGLIINSTSKLNPRAAARKITLDYLVTGEIPQVIADEEKISWVIQQLIDNGIKFTEPGGRVQVECKVRDNQVSIAVTDSGIGIPEKRINEIFEPFHQLDGSSTRRYSGTGLGLAMVKRILEAHGSSIKVFSAVNQGSRFEFSLPVQSNNDVTKV